MEIIKYFGFLICLALFCGPDSSKAQVGGPLIYPHGRYPRIPPLRRIVRPGMYPRRVIYPRTDIYEPSVLPVVGGGGIVRRPAVVSDRSDAQRQNINISNNNENIRENHGSGNVNVNQVTNTRTRSCDCQTSSFLNQCGPYQQCVPDTSCTGGGNGRCVEAMF